MAVMWVGEGKPTLLLYVFVYRAKSEHVTRLGIRRVRVRAGAGAGAGGEAKDSGCRVISLMCAASIF